MIIKPAEINQDGRRALVLYADNPSELGAADEFDEQSYLPGISVPGVPELREPFSVPIRGDYEPVSLVIDYPRMQTGVVRRISFTGMLVDENVLPGSITREPEPAEDPDDLIAVLSNPYDETPLSEAYDEYTGDYGGFLRAVAIQSIDANLGDENSGQGLRGAAEFVLFETEVEFETTQRILETGDASAADIVNVLSTYPTLTRKFGVQ